MASKETENKAKQHSREGRLRMEKVNCWWVAILPKTLYVLGS